MAERDIFKDKIVLVTGGTGTIGSEIVRQLLKRKVNSIRVFDIDENALFNLHHELRDARVRCLVGDVRDRERLKVAMRNVNYVFHCAALKHVPLNEYNPFEAVKTNVIGTQNVLEVAPDCGVEKCINISTDKAVNPINVMGATKLLTERLTTSASVYAGFGRTKFASVRFGNVLNSRGSVVPLFLRQIERDGCVTITHPDTTRFIMSIEQAVSLVLKAAEITKGREIFILKMPAVRIMDLCDALIALSGKKAQKRIIGLRAGEKLHEELMTEEETAMASQTKDMYIIDHAKRGPGPLKGAYSSKDTISYDKVVKLLKDNHVVRA